MNSTPSANVGKWYRDRDGQNFMVVALDEPAGTVEVQYFDGTLEDVDLAIWPELVAAAIAAPEDWTGPFDDLGPDDLGDTEVPRHPVDYDGPWNELDDKERRGS